MGTEDLIHITRARVVHTESKYVLFVLNGVRHTVARSQSKVTANKQLYVKRWIVERELTNWGIDWHPSTNLAVRPKDDEAPTRVDD